MTGVMAVEMFDTAAGVLVNELAMRPHNSGHWTIEGAVTSQFEQHLRAVLDLPLGDTRAGRAGGGDGQRARRRLPHDMYSGYLHCLAHDPGLQMHMYGKQVRPGRKVGHVTTSAAMLTTFASGPGTPPPSCEETSMSEQSASPWSASSWAPTPTGA